MAPWPRRSSKLLPAEFVQEIAESVVEPADAGPPRSGRSRAWPRGTEDHGLQARRGAARARSRGAPGRRSAARGSGSSTICVSLQPPAWRSARGAGEEVEWAAGLTVVVDEQDGAVHLHRHLAQHGHDLARFELDDVAALSSVPKPRSAVSSRGRRTGPVRFDLAVQPDEVRTSGSKIVRASPGRRGHDRRAAGPAPLARHLTRKSCSEALPCWSSHSTIRPRALSRWCSCRTGAGRWRHIAICTASTVLPILLGRDQQESRHVDDSASRSAPWGLVITRVAQAFDG